jgi:hypothetical protein
MNALRKLELLVHVSDEARATMAAFYAGSLDRPAEKLTNKPNPDARAMQKATFRWLLTFDPSKPCVLNWNSLGGERGIRTPDRL